MLDGSRNLAIIRAYFQTDNIKHFIPLSNCHCMFSHFFMHTFSPNYKLGLNTNTQNIQNRSTNCIPFYWFTDVHSQMPYLILISKFHVYAIFFYQILLHCPVKCRESRVEGDIPFFKLENDLEIPYLKYINPALPWKWSIQDMPFRNLH